jgi:hypothetical protein
MILWAGLIRERPMDFFQSFRRARALPRCLITSRKVRDTRQTCKVMYPLREVYGVWHHREPHQSGTASSPGSRNAGRQARFSGDRQRDLAAPTIAAPATRRHLVSAFATNSRLVLGQDAVLENSNEITAIPALIERLDL